MDTKQIEALKRSLIIRPLVFTGDGKKNLEFVEPYYVDKNKPPITIPELKQMKSLLKTLEKTQRGVCRAKRKIYKTLRTNRKSIQIDKNDTEVTEWLQNNDIKYDRYSKKSLNDAIKKCEQQLASLKKSNKQNNGTNNSAIENCEKAIEYLKKLKQIKTVGAEVGLTKLRTKTKESLEVLQKNLKLPTKERDITNYIPTRLVNLLPLDANNIGASKETWWPDSGPPLKEFPYDKYEKACKKFVEAIQDQKLDYYMPDKKKNSEDVELLKYKNERAARKGEVEIAQEALNNMLPTLDDIATKTDTVIDKIRPLIEDLDRRSLKARVKGLSSLYTRLNQELGKSLEELIKSTKEIKSLKANALSTCLGLNGILNDNKTVTATPWRDIDNAFNNVSKYNALTEEIYTKLEKNAMFESRDKLATNTEELTKYVNLIIKYITVDQKDLKERMEMNLVFLGNNLTTYATNLNTQMATAQEKLESFQEASVKAEILLKKLRSTKLGKLLLFKEAYTAELNTLKTLVGLVKSAINSLPI